MPLHEINRKGPGNAWAVWVITETEDWLFRQVVPSDACPSQLHHPKKRLEWLAGRYLIRYLYELDGIPYRGLDKDGSGKPFPIGHRGHVSVTNSFPWVAVQIHPDRPVGIDLETLRPRMVDVVTRILNSEEAKDAGTDTRKHGVYWCAKEALFKWSGRRPVSLRSDISVGPFVMADRGLLSGTVLDEGGRRQTVDLEYLAENDHIMVVTRYSN